MVPKKRNSKSKVRRRRSHQGLKLVQLSPCPHCRAPKLAHHACYQCGKYIKIRKHGNKTTR